MEILLLVLMGVSTLVALVGSLWLIVKAFGTSVVWGLACLFVPGAQLAFVITHWDEVKTPGALWGGGVGCLVLSAVLVPGVMERRRQEQQDRAVEARDQAVASATAAAGARAAKCPPGDPVSDGFSRWCCTGSDWVVISQSCSQLSRPTAECGEANRGTTTLEACSTLGGDPRKRRR
ncbi:MAG: hypothetical protein JNL38_04195 [Myxococcales bacterium]|jgi:hypothetical protein|nr:hypothetical protein [Myxococcales bacterium]